MARQSTTIAGAERCTTGGRGWSVEIDLTETDLEHRETRIKSLRRFGRLSVSLLARRDVIVMKFFSGEGPARPRADRANLWRVGVRGARGATTHEDRCRSGRADTEVARCLAPQILPGRVVKMTKPAAAKRAIKPARTDPLDAIAADWARIGVWLSVTRATDPVDVESLIARTARLVRDDERLFVGAASWLAVHHGWVNGRRLIVLMSDLARTDRLGSAVAGALLTLASTGARALDAGRATELDGGIEACRPLARPRPLFAVVERFPALVSEARADASPLYRRWGLWHNAASLKLTAVRPAAWLLRHVPELRVRALVGPSLESDLVTLALSGPLTARDLARATGVSYTAAHGAADRLVARGLIRRERAGARQLLQLTQAASAALPRSGV